MATIAQVGDEVALGSEAPSAGIAVDSVVVTAADVEITRELRRLVGGPQDDPLIPGEASSWRRSGQPAPSSRARRR